MHIPDGFLDTKTWVSFSGISLGFLIAGVKKIKKKLEQKVIPLLGVSSAFIFAAQMLNFPVAGGTSGHFVGAALAGILLGPFSGVLVMSSVLIVQCLVFQDGGLTALGANIFNMGIFGSFIGYYVFHLFSKIIKSDIGIILGSFFAGWLSTVLASMACAFELAISHTVPLKICLPAMAGVHALIGIGEGLITSIVIGFVRKTRRDIFELEKI